MRLQSYISADLVFGGWKASTHPLDSSAVAGSLADCAIVRPRLGLLDLRLRPQVFGIIGLDLGWLEVKSKYQQLIRYSQRHVFQPSHDVVLSCWALVRQLSK
jgi:hypothetical protein